MKSIFLLLLNFVFMMNCRTVDELVDPVHNKDGKFQIVFKLSGEVVLDDSHLEMYEIKEGRHFLYLNASGIEKINSYMKWNTQWNHPTPNPEAIFLKDFVVKFDGVELYSGRFFSNICSSIYSGYTIMDVFIFSQSRYLTIEKGYPTGAYFEGTDLRRNTVLVDYLKSKGKFKETD